MAQNQDGETGVIGHFCDSCGKPVNGKEPLLLLPVASIWGGTFGPGILVCACCAKDKLDLDLKAYLRA